MFVTITENGNIPERVLTLQGDSLLSCMKEMLLAFEYSIGGEAIADNGHIMRINSAKRLQEMKNFTIRIIEEVP